MGRWGLGNYANPAGQLRDATCGEGLYKCAKYS